MPTGYTDMIDSGKVDNAVDWIERGLVRAFGVAFPLREDAWNLPYEEFVVTGKTVRGENVWGIRLKRWNRRYSLRWI